MSCGRLHKESNLGDTASRPVASMPLLLTTDLYGQILVASTFVSSLSCLLVDLLNFAQRVKGRPASAAERSSDEEYIAV